MRIIDNDVTGDLVLNENAIITATVTGQVTVRKGSSLSVTGAICGDLVLQRGTTALVEGNIFGDVINNGGYLHIFGAVTGKVEENSGRTVVEKKSSITF